MISGNLASWQTPKRLKQAAAHIEPPLVSLQVVPRQEGYYPHFGSLGISTPVKILVDISPEHYDRKLNEFRF